MDFYFNINMDSTYAGKYSTLMCFHPATLQGSQVLSKPLDITSVGLHASQSYCPTYTMHGDPFITLFTIYSTLKHLLNPAYPL